PWHGDRKSWRAGPVSGVVNDAFDRIYICVDLAIHAIIVLREAIEYIKIACFNLHLDDASEDIAAHFCGAFAVRFVRWVDGGKDGTQCLRLSKPHDAFGIATV